MKENFRNWKLTSIIKYLTLIDDHEITFDFTNLILGYIRYRSMLYGFSWFKREEMYRDLGTTKKKADAELNRLIEQGKITKIVVLTKHGQQVRYYPRKLTLTETLQIEREISENQSAVPPDYDSTKITFREFLNSRNYDKVQRNLRHKYALSEVSYFEAFVAWQRMIKKQDPEGKEKRTFDGWVNRLSGFINTHIPNSNEQQQ